MKNKISVADFLSLGGDLAKITEGFNQYDSKEFTSIEYSHTNRPSFGSPNGTKMYKINTLPKEIAEIWLYVQVEVELKKEYKK